MADVAYSNVGLTTPSDVHLDVYTEVRSLIFINCSCTISYNLSVTFDRILCVYTGTSGQGSVKRIIKSVFNHCGMQSHRTSFN